jgi:hypothetical protein
LGSQYLSEYTRCVKSNTEDDNDDDDVDNVDDDEDNNNNNKNNNIDNDGVTLRLILNMFSKSSHYMSCKRKIWPMLMGRISLIMIFI